MLSRTLLSMSLLAAGSGASYAEIATQPYGGIQYLAAEFNQLGVDADLDALVFRGGLKFNEHISAEVRLAQGIGDNTVEITGSVIELEIDKMSGIYLLLSTRKVSSITPYFAIGYTDGELDFAGTSDSDSSQSWGFGLNLDVSDNAYATFEYMRYLDTSESGFDIKFDGFSFGVNALF